MSFDRAELAAALETLAGGGLVAFPSETVWGLAACARSPSSVAALTAWKGRADRQPISILVSGQEILSDCGFAPDRAARRLMDGFWPGPLTLVLPCQPVFAPGIARDDGAVGVRCSSHPGAAEFVRAAEALGLGPITATSCNRSGQAPARSEDAARALCAGNSAGPRVLGWRGEGTPPAEPTTVLDLAAEPPRILRQGTIAAAVLESYLDVETLLVAPGREGRQEGESSG